MLTSRYSGEWMRKIQLALMVPPWVKDRLGEIARSDGRTPSIYACRVLEGHFREIDARAVTEAAGERKEVLGVVGCSDGCEAPGGHETGLGGHSGDLPMGGLLMSDEEAKSVETVWLEWRAAQVEKIDAPSASRELTAFPSRALTE